MADPTSDLVVADDLTIPASELRWRFSRSSGPGGQSVNTSDSRVELFDHQTDPRETRNIASENPAIVRELTKQLNAGWRGAL